MLRLFEVMVVWGIGLNWVRLCLLLIILLFICRFVRFILLYKVVFGLGFVIVLIVLGKFVNIILLLYVVC